MSFLELICVRKRGVGKEGGEEKVYGSHSAISRKRRKRKRGRGETSG